MLPSSNALSASESTSYESSIAMSCSDVVSLMLLLPSMSATPTVLLLALALPKAPPMAEEDMRERRRRRIYMNRTSVCIYRSFFSVLAVFLNGRRSPGYGNLKDCESG